MLQLLALSLSLALPPQHSSSDVVQLLIGAGDTLDWPGQPAGAEWVVLQVGEPSVDELGGWTAAVRVERADPGGSGVTTVIVGQDFDQLNEPVRLIRGRSTLGGVTQRELRNGRRVNGQLLYMSSRNGSPDISRDVWIDDTRILQSGSPVAGSGGWRWGSFDKLDMGTNGRILIQGHAVAPGSPNSYVMLADITTGEMLFNARDGLPGLDEVVDRVIDLDVSRDGSHWSVIARQNPSGDEALIVDGHVLSLAPGFLAVHGQPAPPKVSQLIGPLFLERIYGAQVRDDGTVTALYLFIDPAVGAATVVMRGDRPVLIDDVAPFPTDLSVDADGAAVTLEGALLSAQNPVIRLESEIVMRMRPGLDLDFDGLADVELSLGTIEANFLSSSNVGGPVPFAGKYRVDFTGFSEAILRTRPARIDTEVCSGTPNSTGHVGQLALVGSPLVAEQELTLRLFDLPAGSLGFGLFSMTPGPMIQPGGSEGFTCLAGDIGRFLPGAFVTDLTGSAVIRPDLQAIPQPTSTVPILAGETWYCQIWHRDLSMGALTSNFSTAVEVAFQ